MWLGSYTSAVSDALSMSVAGEALLRLVRDDCDLMLLREDLEDGVGTERYEGDDNGDSSLMGSGPLLKSRLAKVELTSSSACW